MADDEIEWTAWQKGTQLITHYLYDFTILATKLDPSLAGQTFAATSCHLRHGFRQGSKFVPCALAPFSRGPIFTWSPPPNYDTLYSSVTIPGQAGQ